MTLYDQIREDEAKLKALGQDGDNGDQDPVDDNADDDNRADDAAEDAAPAKKADDAKPDATKKAEDDAAKGDDPAKKADDAAKGDDQSLAAQLRIERKQKKELEARLAAMEAAKATPPAATPAKTTETPAEGAPKAATAEERLAKLETEREQTKLYTQAVSEFHGFEREFSKSTPDYEAASSHMIQKMADGIRSIYPTADDAQVGAFLQRQVLTIAGQAVARGLNPAETLYLMAHERYGYKAAPATPAADDPAKKAADAAKRLATAAANKRRSASPLAGGGQGGGASATIEEAANMDLGSFSKLSDSEINRMISDLQ